jgi:hypothetical protein
MQVSPLYILWEHTRLGLRKSLNLGSLECSDVFLQEINAERCILMITANVLYLRVPRFVSRLEGQLSRDILWFPSVLQIKR